MSCVPKACVEAANKGQVAPPRPFDHFLFDAISFCVAQKHSQRNSSEAMWSMSTSASNPAFSNWSFHLFPIFLLQHDPPVRLTMNQKWIRNGSDSVWDLVQGQILANELGSGLQRSTHLSIAGKGRARTPWTPQIFKSNNLPWCALRHSCT